MLLLNFGVSICTFLNFCVLFLFCYFNFSFDTCGWFDGSLVFRLSTGPLIRQSCCLSPFAHRVPSAHHPQELHYELDAVLSVSL